MILVLTCRQDATADLVVEELNRRSAEVFRADTRELAAHRGPYGLRASALLDGGRWSARIAGRVRGLDLGAVRSVYYRRPTGWRPVDEIHDHLNPQAQQVTTTEAPIAWGGLLRALDVPEQRWLPHPDHARRAEYKPLQLAAAQAAGLDVPRTLITNDPAEAARFAAEQPTVYKPFRPARGTLNGRRAQTYTTPVTPEQITDGVALTAHMFQEQICDKAFEVRLTVVGDRFFGAAITARSEAAWIDWRSDYDHLDYRVIEIPAPIRSAVRGMMEQLHLVYGAIDFVVARDGAWWFLEVNANGQFGWIEQATGLPITAAIADYLQGC